MAKHDKVADEAIRASLATAFEQLRGGSPTDAVHTLSETFLALIRNHPELLDEKVATRAGQPQVPVVTRWPALGANLVAGSVKAGAPEIEFVRERFAMSEALTYYEFTTDLAIDHAQ